jgi:lipoprotein-anchoring transpeptidase ErfK/SrfK
MPGARPLLRTWAATAAVATPLLAAPGAVAADVRPLDARGPIGTEQLSDERTITRFANATTRTRSARGRRRGRRRRAAAPWTESGFREVYLALRAPARRVGRLWSRSASRAGRTGRRGWVLRSSVGHLRSVRTKLVVDRRRLRATLFLDGRRIWRSRIGVGAPGTPTPGGSFYVRERIRVPPGTIYGPWAFGTSAYSVLSDWPGGGVVGIHGTNRPDLIPAARRTAASGCPTGRSAASRGCCRWARRSASSEAVRQADYSAAPPPYSGSNAWTRRRA